LMRLDDDPELALHEMQIAGGEHLERLDPVWGTYPMWLCAQACIALGRIDEADEWARRLETHPGTVAGMGGPITRAAGARAGVLLAREDADAAAEVALAAADRAAELELVSDEVEVRITAGRALAAAGRRDDAVAALQAAAAKAARGGARLWTDAAGRELRRLGARLSAGTARAGSTGEGLDGLTEREQEIAALVADGMSNKQVASAIYLSEKTVENHLSKIFAKVGVRSRVELTKVITERT
jgi:DNA-binding NarL/FixJ family response regulator